MGQPQISEHAGRSSEFRWNVGRDVSAGALLAVALLLPWNLSFGVGVPGSSPPLFVLLLVVTLFAFAALIATYAGHRGRRSASPASPRPSHLRVALSLPYLVVAAGFVGFGVVQAFRLGGSGEVPPGVGPGLLAGLAGALLAAQSPLRDAVGGSRPDLWARAAHLIGVIAALVASFSVVANVYWRVRYPVQALADGIYGMQNIAVIATTIVYGVVPWAAVLVGLRWSLSDRVPARLASVALGGSALLGSALVWILGVGRDVDAYHGIAQTTGSVSVGFEGYVAWTAVAAIVGIPTLRAALKVPVPQAYWRHAIRMCLTLIVLWCLGSALRRIFDLVVAASLDMPFSAYDSIALMAFDICAAVAALWIRLNVKNNGLLPAILSAAAGVLSVLMVCRVVVGVGLAPRVLYADEPEAIANAVYGNNLDQQITSTFDVVLCVLALCITAIAAAVMQRNAARVAAEQEQSGTSAVPSPAPHDYAAAAPTAAVPTSAAPTSAAPTSAVPTVAVPTATAPDPAVPRIVRNSGGPTQRIASAADRKPRIKRVLEESTQRFGAGTTYTGTGPRQPPRQG